MSISRCYLFSFMCWTWSDTHSFGLDKKMLYEDSQISGQCSRTILFMNWQMYIWLRHDSWVGRVLSSEYFEYIWLGVFGFYTTLFWDFYPFIVTLLRRWICVLCFGFYTVRLIRQWKFYWWWYNCFQLLYPFLEMPLNVITLRNDVVGIMFICYIN